MRGFVDETAQTEIEEALMSMFRRAVLALTLAAPMAMTAPAFAQDKDIVDTAAANKDFSTLVAAVKAAGLVETLKGKGPFTVFAPTDDAFKKLPAGTLENLLKPENKKTLTSILTYHVLPGTYDAARITKPTVKTFGIKSVEGSNINVNLSKGVVVSGATVSKTDIKTSNGIIHVIDTVMIPRKIKLAMAMTAMKEKAKAAIVKTKEVGAKAVEATKDAAGKAMDATKSAADKAKEAVTPAAPATAPAAPAVKKP
jgi:uncharacterized surface protein with fasciclin (FAS1) repeats